MGKNKKKDEGKKAALQARKEAKADKAAQKRLRKETLGSGGVVEDTAEEEDLDSLLDFYKKRDQSVDTPTLETLDGFPPPRGNASLTLVEDKNAHLYLFGGEYYDGVENLVLSDLLRFDATKMEWKQIQTPTCPAPRCAHSCVAYKKSLYVFGGELANADQYHHYKDLWKFDTTQNQWQELTSTTRNGPSARSGHIAFLYKSYMVLFGGFYEALKETRWYNDLHVFDLQAQQWLDIPHSKLTARPEPRSAANVGVYGDVAIVQGGYSKLHKSATQTAAANNSNKNSNSEAKVHNDAWILHLKPLQQGKPPTWERMSSMRITTGPRDRSGTSSASYKNRMLVFGGVVDEEEVHHKMVSVFYSNLFAFDMDRRKWFPVKVKASSTQQPGNRRRKKKDDDTEDQEEDNATIEDDEDVTLATEVEDDLEDDLVEEDDGAAEPSGWDLDMLRSNMFAFIDGNGNIVYEKIDDEDAAPETAKLVDSPPEESSDEEEETKKEEKDDSSSGEEEETKEVDSDDVAPKTVQRERIALPDKKVGSSEVMAVNEETGTPEAVTRREPLPRINACMVVRSNILYLYGGLLEVGDREVTLDDCWAFDLRKRTQWQCLWEGTMHKQVWKGAIHDDDDSYISGGGDDDDDLDDDDDEYNLDGSEFAGGKAEEKIAKKDKKRAGVKEEIAELKSQLDLENSDRTPLAEEPMADFFARTSDYWTQQAASTMKVAGDEEVLSRKEMKREGFKMAQERYDELKPVLDRLNALELRKSGSENERNQKKSLKDDKKKKKKKDK